MSYNPFLTTNQPNYGQGTVTSYTGTAGTAAALVPGSQAVWIMCTTAAYVKVGVSATATTADFPLPANFPIVLPVPSEGCRVSAIQVASGGNLHVIPLAG